MIPYLLERQAQFLSKSHQQIQWGQYKQSFPKDLTFEEESVPLLSSTPEELWQARWQMLHYQRKCSSLKNQPKLGTAFHFHLQIEKEKMSVFHYLCLQCNSFKSSNILEKSKYSYAFDISQRICVRLVLILVGQYLKFRKKSVMQKGKLKER